MQDQDVSRLQRPPNHRFRGRIREVGLTTAFDRTRQLAAYFRHTRPGVATTIGGPIARALPKLCRRIFDYVCLGDVESIGAVIDDAFGSDHRAEIAAPRFDLMGFTGGLGFVETSRNCNFACTFCSLTGESRPYASYPAEDIERQLAALGKVPMLMVLDNNFYGNSRAGFERRTRLLGEHWRRGAFRGWGCLVTGDFFKRPENLEFIAANGCRAIFSGVESLDPAVLNTFNKRHSLSSDPRILSDSCAEHGIMFDYGMMLDFGQQTIGEVGAQLDAVLSNPLVPLPGLLSLTIPILGTPYFNEAARAGRLMPNLCLSDLDGQKLVEWPKEPLDRVVPFVADLLAFRSRKSALVRHAFAQAMIRRKQYQWELTALTLVRPLVRHLWGMRFGSLRQMRQSWREPSCTYCSLTDRLRSAYKPQMPLPSRFSADFQPLMVTDEHGAPTADVCQSAMEIKISQAITM